MGFKGSLGAIHNHKPVRRRNWVGYAITVILAVVGFAVGLLLHSFVAAAVAAFVILILGIVANEIWGNEVHQHHDHYTNL